MTPEESAINLSPQARDGAIDDEGDLRVRGSESFHEGAC
jgi:hypothetical protein